MSVTVTAPSVAYRFGRFELEPDERRLLASGAPVHLRPRAFDLLVALVERSGHLVTKDELLQRVWGKVIVEENTLQVNISALRKVLGANAIAAVLGRGYRFTLEVTRFDTAPIAPAASPKHNLPHRPHEFHRPRQGDRGACAAPCWHATSHVDRLGRLREDALGDPAREATRQRVLRRRMARRACGTDGRALLPQTVASVLGIKEKIGASLIDTIAEHISSRPLLLVLDNAEHLLDACAQLAESLLRRCERLTILVTSRERLGITGELIYRVPSLSVPDQETDQTPESIAAYESAQLLIERARLHRPDFAISARNSAAIASICRRLDGVALALELVAPRVRTLSVDELSRRLDQRFELLTEGSRTALPRHRTLRSLMDWSYDLLNDAEKAMLRRVSVFSGGWTLEAAQQVCCGEVGATSDAFDLLSSLAEKNLILAETHNATRYGMLETVRQYAQDLLRKHGEETQIHRLHLAYMLARADEANGKRVDASPAWLDRLEMEIDNMRAALSWSTSAGGDAASGLRLAAALHGLWQVRGHLCEGRGWLSRLLAAVPAGQEDPARAKALRLASALAQQQDDYSAAEALAHQALESYKTLNQRSEIAEALETLGNLARNRRDFAIANALYEECLAVRQEAGDRGGAATALWCLGYSASEAGDQAAARAWLEKSETILRELNDWRVAYPLSALAVADYLQHDYASAKGRLAEALRFQRQAGHRLGIARSLTTIGMIAHDEEDIEGARDALMEALRLLHDLGNRHHLCQALEGLAAVARVLQGDEAAARIWGSAERMRENIACPIAPSWLPWYEREVTAARAAVSDDAAFDFAWNQGRAMTLDQAVDFALNIGSAELRPRSQPSRCESAASS